jgi:hypothetical protein
MSSRYVEDFITVNHFNSDTDSQPVPRSIRVYERASSGGNTANFRSVKKSDLPVNNYNLSVQRHKPFRYVERVSIDGYNRYVDNSYLPQLLSPDPDWLSTLESAAASKFNSQLRTMDVNLAQAFGERHQVVSMLSNTARRFTTSYSHLKRGRLYSALRSLNLNSTEFNQRSRGGVLRFYNNYPKNPAQAASNAWLEMSYGWRPLLNDIYGSAKFLAESKVARESDSFYKLHTTSSKSKLVEKQTQILEGLVGTYDLSIRYKVSYLVQNELLRYSALMGMTNPALLAWELTPFSFVVDWFLPIGSYLKSIDAAYGLVPLRGSRTYLMRLSVSGSASGFISDANPEYGGWVIYGGKSHLTNMERVSTGFPNQQFPSFRSPDSVNIAISAIALLVQTFRKK